MMQAGNPAVCPAPSSSAAALTVEAGGYAARQLSESSGAPGGDADEACAKAGIEAVRDRLDF